MGFWKCHSLAFVLILILSELLTVSEAQSSDHEIDGVAETAVELSNRIDIEIGYFTARREMFRKLYGSYLDYGIEYERALSKHFSVGMRTEFIQLSNAGNSWSIARDTRTRWFRYWTLSFTPTINYRFRCESTLLPVAGMGLGLCYRNAGYTHPEYTGPGSPLVLWTMAQHDLTVAAVAMTGFDLHLSQAVVLGGRFYFDYHPLGDPSTGAFGDTGGYHFTFRLGRKF